LLSHTAGDLVYMIKLTLARS